MHELFLTAAVKDGDFDMACAVLQGYTWMEARHNIYHITYWSGQPQPKGLRNLNGVASRQGNPQAPFKPQWNELKQHLARSSYVLQLEHEVSHSDFGAPQRVPLNDMPGALRWADFPDIMRDPSAPQRKALQMPGQVGPQKKVEVPDLPITQRKRIDIPNEKSLLTVMADNDLAYKTELIQETFVYVSDNIEYSLHRYYYLPNSRGQSAPTGILPPWTELKPLDPARKWTLHVKLTVVEDGQPEKMRNAAEELLALKAKLDQLFEFKVIDRRVFDSRIAPPPIAPGRPM